MGLSRSKILLALLAAVAFLPFLGSRDVVISHEARVVQTARQMAESGWPWNARLMSVPAVKLAPDEEGSTRPYPDYSAPPLQVNPWLVPVLNEELRLQKPPLPYWVCAVVFKAAGGWNEMLARVVPAVLGALGTLLVYDLARRMIGRRHALAAGLVWASSYFIADEYRKTMADPYLGFFALLGVWGWVRSREKVRDLTTGAQPPPCPPPGYRGRVLRGGVLWFYLAMGLGFLAKGPVILVHVLLPVGVWEGVRWNKRRTSNIEHRTSNIEVRGWWVHLVGVGVALVIALPWYWYVLGHVPHAREIWRYESVGEMLDNKHNARPMWFYVPGVFQVALPWPGVWVVGMGWAVWRRKWRTRQMVPAVWWILLVLFFSMGVNLKKNAYLLPGMPAQTLVIAQGAVGLMGIVRRVGKRHWGSWVLAGTTLAPVGVALAMPVLMERRVLGGVLAMLPLGLGIAGLMALERRRVREWLGWTSAAGALATALFLNFVLAEDENGRSPRPVAAAVKRLLAEHADLTVIPGKLPPEVAVYLPMEVSFDRLARRVVYVIDDPVRRDGKRRAAVDEASFEKRLEGMEVGAVNEVGTGEGGRYRVFIVEVGVGRVVRSQ